MLVLYEVGLYNLKDGGVKFSTGLLFVFNSFPPQSAYSLSNSVQVVLQYSSEKRKIEPPGVSTHLSFEQ